MKKFLIIILIVLGLAVIGAVGVGIVAYNNFYIARGGEVKQLEIQEGMGVKEIGAFLESEQIIKSSYAFEWYVYLKKAGAELQAGTYSFDPNQSLAEITERLRQGNVENQEYQVTIPEGLRYEEVANIFEQAGYITAAEFKQAVQNTDLDERISKFFPEATNLEGFLYPETYRFFKDSTADEIVAKLVDSFFVNFDETLMTRIQQTDLSLYETLILASIVQGESGDAENQPLVASVFENRLDLGMKLESDVTIFYLTGEKGLRATLDQLEIDSPYNTYKYTGLTPGPINSPSIQAINAVIDAPETDFLYFISSLETGETYFAKTFEEHEQLIQEHLE